MEKVNNKHTAYDFNLAILAHAFARAKERQPVIASWNIRLGPVASIRGFHRVTAPLIGPTTYSRHEACERDFEWRV